MRQVLQSLRDGSTEVADVPEPAVRRGHLLIETSRSLLSAGTERMLVEFGRAGWLEKARRQPDKVRMVWDKIRTDGVLPTLEAVRHKLDQPLPMGYCNVGRVLEVGSGVSGFAIGDRVVSNGRHAEVVCVPVNLCAKIPEAVSDDEAAFTVLAAIGLQGIRLVQPTLGEAVVVIGLGLIGLLTVQLLRAHGCRVLGIDMDETKVVLARRFGAEALNLRDGADPVAASLHFSRGRGVDAVIITASTRSSEPMHQAAKMCRKRGRIVLVGVAGLELSRADFYEKELTFQVSCSYGPGRYDPAYEDKGIDYPVGFVRWTEQRNFEAVLDMLVEKRLEVAPLISHRFPIQEAERAYALIASAEPSLGVVLEYPPRKESPLPQRSAQTVTLPAQPAPARDRAPTVSVIGAGNYAGAILIPALRRAGVRFAGIASANGVSAVHLGRKFGFRQATTDVESLITDRETDVVVIATRHDTHADFVVRALEAGKHVFVEKPLALTHDELVRIERAAARAPKQLLMVGFNRRFAPQVGAMKRLLAGVAEPKALVMTVNAGAVAAGHWTEDPETGGGRLLGEGCHFVDLLRFLVGVAIASFDVAPLAGASRDSASVTLRFADGSVGTIHYLTNGHKGYPKERLEVFCAGRVLRLDNFKKLTGFGWPGFRKLNLWRQDKGQTACVKAFVDAVRQGAASPIPLSELLEVGRVSIDLAGARS